MNIDKMRLERKKNCERELAKQHEKERKNKNDSQAGGKMDKRNLKETKERKQREE